MKLLLLFLLPFTFHAQSIDSLQHEMELFKFENKTLRGIMITYVHQIDTLYIITKGQESEIDLLSTELEKLINQQGVSAITDRKCLTEISGQNIVVTEEILVRMKLYVNNEGRVIIVKVLNTTGEQDSKVVDLIVAMVKSDIRYESLENAAIQTAYYSVKIIP